jgi:hypothetical protein
MKFIEYVQQRDPEFLEEFSFDSIKKFAKKWPASIAAAILGTGVIGGSKLADKFSAQMDPHAEVEQKPLKPGLPPLPKNPKPPKIIKRIEDAGRV